jgi:hypothetical protein
MRIALLIPCTSKGRDEWSSMKDTYLYNYTLKTFLLTYSKEYEYTFYIGYDNDDRIYSKSSEQRVIKLFKTVFNNIVFEFIPFINITKGHVTKMWNILFKQAYHDGCDFFFQCGDDINFKTKDWVKDCITVLQENNNIGLSGPLNNNNRILTQAMVSRKHMEIFGSFFPEEIINWCCDDWYNYVYHPSYFYPLKQHFCSNEGGLPRYEVNNDPNFVDDYKNKVTELRKKAFELAQSDKIKIDAYIYNNNISN